MYLSTLSLSEKAKYKSQIHSICTCTYCTGTGPMSGFHVPVGAGSYFLTWVRMTLLYEASIAKFIPWIKNPKYRLSSR